MYHPAIKGYPHGYGLMPHFSKVNPIGRERFKAEATTPLELRQGIAGQLDLRRGAALQQLHLAGSRLNTCNSNNQYIYIRCILILLNIHTYMYVCM
jgi:hypothetical protein